SSVPRNRWSRTSLWPDPTVLVATLTPPTSMNSVSNVVWVVMDIPYAAHSSPKRFEPRAEVRHDRHGLLPGREVGALAVLAVEKKFRVGALRPGLRGGVDLVRESAHDHRELHAPGVEEAAALGQVSGRPVQ